MNDTPPPVRRPAAFSLTPDKEQPKKSAEPKPVAQRPPKALPAPRVEVVPVEQDVFDKGAIEALEPPAEAPARRRPLGLASLFLASIGVLVSAALGLWLDQLIRDLFSRSDWLGWGAVAVATLAALSLLAIVIREWVSLRRLAAVEKLRSQAASALAANDARSARKAVAEMNSMVTANPASARGRTLLAETEDEIIDGADLIRLAEREVLAPLDREARAMVLNAAKRVSVVTAVSPRALVDVGYVLFESARLVRRLAEHYGGRPGTLGFIRLARNVIAHLAVTGSIAVGDSLIQQLVGHGIAARLSARLGEGVINGLMTARIGISAMDLVRPFPFEAVRRPRMSDFLSDLVSFQQSQTAGTKPDSTR